MRNEAYVRREMEWLHLVGSFDSTYNLRAFTWGFIFGKFCLLFGELSFEVKECACADSFGLGLGRMGHFGWDSLVWLVTEFHWDLTWIGNTNSYSHRYLVLQPPHMHQEHNIEWYTETPKIHVVDTTMRCDKASCPRLGPPRCVLHKCSRRSFNEHDEIRHQKIFN